MANINLTGQVQGPLITRTISQAVSLFYDPTQSRYLSVLQLSNTRGYLQITSRDTFQLSITVDPTDGSANTGDTLLRYTAYLVYHDDFSRLGYDCIETESLFWYKFERDFGAGITLAAHNSLPLADRTLNNYIVGSSGDNANPGDPLIATTSFNLPNYGVRLFFFFELNPSVTSGTHQYRYNVTVAAA